MNTPTTEQTRPKTGHTRSRNIRVPDDRWHAAMANAKARGTDVSKIVNDALEDYNRRCADGDIPIPPAA